jgi:hypothetical protein
MGEDGAEEMTVKWVESLNSKSAKRLSELRAGGRSLGKASVLRVDRNVLDQDKESGKLIRKQGKS